LLVSERWRIGPFYLIVTVALGSVFANGVLSKDISIAPSITVILVANPRRHRRDRAASAPGFFCTPNWIRIAVQQTLLAAVLHRHVDSSSPGQTLELGAADPESL
jgi:hypothetical protein